MISLLLTPFFDKIVGLLFGTLDYSWQRVFLMLKLAIALGLFGFSAFIRDYREENGNFEDTKGFAKVLDGMISKLR